MLRVNTKPRRKNAPRLAEKSAPGFLKWLRGRGCLVCLALRQPPIGGIEAAHVDYAGGKGVGTKVADRYAIPLCSSHHAEQHQFGWSTFEARHSLDAAQAAAIYWIAWPGRIAWERKLEDVQYTADGKPTTPNWPK